MLILPLLYYLKWYMIRSQRIIHKILVYLQRIKIQRLCLFPEAWTTVSLNLNQSHSVQFLSDQGTYIIFRSYWAKLVSCIAQWGKDSFKVLLLIWSLSENMYWLFIQIIQYNNELFSDLASLSQPLPPSVLPLSNLDQGRQHAIYRITNRACIWRFLT